MSSTKQDLLNKCKILITEKIDQFSKVIREAQISSNSDTKSSAGDKYETGRAMAQLEIEKSTFQRAEAQKQLAVLERCLPDVIFEIAGVGSVVYTDSGNYFLSVSAGLIKSDNKSFYAISINSPIGQKLMGLKKGDKFEFNGKTIAILEVN